MKLFFIVLLLVPFSAAGQTAKVIQLDPADAAQAKSLYAQQQEINKKLADFTEQMRIKYTTVDDKSQDRGNVIVASPITGITWGCFQSGSSLTFNGSGQMQKSKDDDAAYAKCEKDLAAEQAKQPPLRYYRMGWSDGFVYSEDFRFIVPAPYTPPSNSWSNGCIQVAPAFSNRGGI